MVNLMSGLFDWQRCYEDCRVATECSGGGWPMCISTYERERVWGGGQELEKAGVIWSRA